MAGLVRAQTAEMSIMDSDTSPVASPAGASVEDESVEVSSPPQAARANAPTTTIDKVVNLFFIFQLSGCID